MKKMQQNPLKQWDGYKKTPHTYKKNTRREEKKQRAEKIFEVKMADSFPNLATENVFQTKKFKVE